VEIKEVLNQALSQELEGGLKWYQEAHEYCKELSEEFGISLSKVCGIVSALSPLKEWGLNKRIAKQYLEGKRNVHTKLQITKCDLIMQGKNIDVVLGGLKTINFYHNLLNPKDRRYCTIDTHIMWMYPYPNLTPKRYQKIKKDFIDYSELIPNQVQAQAWLTIKRIKHDPTSRKDNP
jgi:hypothetical protein